MDHRTLKQPVRTGQFHGKKCLLNAGSLQSERVIPQVIELWGEPRTAYRKLLIKPQAADVKAQRISAWQMTSLGSPGDKFGNSS